MKRFLLVGNANTGKTTLLNSLTKSTEHTGNWHGVTVEEKAKYFSFLGEEFCVVDLPGIYSLNPLSFEEQVSSDYIFSHKDDVILCTADINTIQKNLYLALDLISAGREVILLVNNMGESRKKIDKKHLENSLGIKVCVLDFDNKDDIHNLKIFLKNYQKQRNNFDIIDKIYAKKTLDEIDFLCNKFLLKKFEIIKIIEKNTFFCKKNQKIMVFFDNYQKINNFSLAEEKYLFIEKIIKIQNSQKYYGNEFLDKILLNKFLCIPIFFLILILIFYLTFFSIGSFLSDVLAQVFQVELGGAVVGWLKSFCEIPWVIGLVEDGLFSGVGSLVSFLPQVVMLFLFLAILENTGYFSRVAFMFDDLFSSIGLTGKSTYTLLMGFGCSASAVLTARTMDSKNMKIKTAIMTPYMSCSAKLPIYAVLGGAFFGASNVFIIFLLYLIGVFVALLVGIFLDFIGLKNKETAFLLEFPPYRLPKLKKVCGIAWQNLKMFLIKITTIFISMSIIVWCLGSFDFGFNYVADSGGKSILQVLGEFFAPLFLPLGFDNWGAVSALLAGIVAKEVIVSSIAIFNGISYSGEVSTAKIQASLLDANSAVSFSCAGALSYLSFSLLYSPCLATMAVMKKEIGLKWTLVAILIQLIVAYLTAFVVFNVYKISQIIGLASTALIIFSALAVIFSVFKIIDFLRCKNKCKNCGYCKN